MVKIARVIPVPLDDVSFPDELSFDVFWDFGSSNLYALYDSGLFEFLFGFCSSLDSAIDYVRKFYAFDSSFLCEFVSGLG